MRDEGTTAMKDELKKYYKDLIEEWKIDLVLARIERMGFQKSYWPDLMQELAVLLLGFQYDPSDDSGATEETVLYSVITQRLRHLRRCLIRQAGRQQRHANLCGSDDEPVEYPFHPTGVPTTDEIAAIMAALSESDREICSALSSGSTRTQIARQLDCDWHTVNRAVMRIRKRFNASEINGRVQW